MSAHPTAHLPLPALRFEGEGRVSSGDFDDVYFSRADGAAETRYVFLQHNGLPERYAGRAHFSIAELGFGTGLNFQETYRQFLEQPDGHLHYISVEKFPLTQDQLRELHGEADWITAYPLRLPGWHRVHLPRCMLTLGFGEAVELFTGINVQIDAWFLDGFAPAKNPDMWSDALFQNIARLSAPDATFATFTAAGFVKRGLAAVGFAVQKVQGFAHKREMLVGVLRSAEEVSRCSAHAVRAAKRHWSAKGEGGVSPPSIIVLGAGMAGATTARALADRGYRVTVLEENAIASGASGNAAGVLYPQLTKYYQSGAAWHLLAYGFMLRQLQRWKNEGLNFRWEQPGMVRLPREKNARQLLESLRPDPAIAQLVSAQEASTLLGISVAQEGIYFPQGSWIAPAELCAALLQHASITLQQKQAVNIERLEDTWRVTTSENERLEASHVILCTAEKTTALLPEYAMPIGSSAGQVTRLQAPTSLHAIVSHQGYVIPVNDLEWLAGATYDRSDLSRMVTEANHQTNLQHVREALSGIEPGDVLEGRTSIRATTPDRLPYVGALEEGLYVNVGHGSRGMISAPFAAEVIASQITGEMAPLTPALHAAIDPRRRQGNGSR